MEAWRESKRAACPQDLWLELIHQYQLFLDSGGRLVNGAESSFIYTSSRAQVNKSRNKKNIMRPPTSQFVAASMVSSFFLSLFCTVLIILFFNAWQRRVASDAKVAILNFQIYFEQRKIRIENKFHSLFFVYDFQIFRFPDCQRIDI